MSLEGTPTEELLTMVMGGDSQVEMLEAISDDLKVLWLAQQSEALEPQDFGLFLVRLQARVDIAAEFARRASSAEVAHRDEEHLRLLGRLEALEARLGRETSVKLHIVKSEPERGPFAGGPAS